jgi:hypothetical protein
VLNAVEKYWAQEFKHAPAGTQGRSRLVRWQQSDRLRELFAVLYGAYPCDLNLKEDFAGEFLSGLRAEEVQIDLNGQVPSGLERVITPIRLTGVDLRGYGGAAANWIGGVYFGDAKDAADLTTFWNLRAAGNEIEFAPLADLFRLEQMVKAHLKYLDELPNQHPTIENHFLVYYQRGRNHQQIMSLLGQLSTTKKALFAPCDDSHLGDDPALFCFDREQALAFIENEAGTYSALVTLPEKQFLVHSDRFVDDQSLAVSVEERVNFAYPNHTLSPPFRIELTETLRPQDRYRPVDNPIREAGPRRVHNRRRQEPPSAADQRDGCDGGVAEPSRPFDRTKRSWTTCRPASGGTGRTRGCASVQDSRSTSVGGCSFLAERHWAW